MQPVTMLADGSQSQSYHHFIDIHPATFSDYIFDAITWTDAACVSSQRECDHLLSLINRETGLVLGEVSTLSMFYCNTCCECLPVTHIYRVIDLVVCWVDLNLGTPQASSATIRPHYKMVEPLTQPNHMSRWTTLQ